MLAATVTSWFVTDFALWKAATLATSPAIRSTAAITDAGFLR